MAKRDLYEVLGVERGASDAELKKAYRQKAMKLHPDRNPGDKEAEKGFKEVNEAYEILKDPQKRAAYDRMGHAAFEAGMGGGAGNGFGGFGGFDFGQGGADFSDMFEDLFGDVFSAAGRGGGRRGGTMRGADLRYNLEISLEDAFHGKNVKLRVPTVVNCETCDGSGAKKGTKPETCSQCNGSGQVRMQQGFFSLARSCPACGGSGQTIREKCGDCHGNGRVQKEKTISVHIPAGVDQDSRIRLNGEGEAGVRGGQSGDLYIFINVKKHELFERHGRDLMVDVPVSFIDAALGGTVEVPTVDGGRVKITLPEGTQPEQQFRVRGKGMPGLNGASTGDMYVNAMVEVPTGLSSKQKKLLEELRGSLKGTKNLPNQEGFLAKVKKFWSAA